MHHFEYRNGTLHAEGVSLARIAEEVGTPFYCYSPQPLSATTRYSPMHSGASTH